jgi:hypothetical protein
MTPEAALEVPFPASSRDTWNKRNDKESFQMFAMTESRKAIDVAELTVRIHHERERHQAGGPIQIDRTT